MFYNHDDAASDDDDDAADDDGGDGETNNQLCILFVCISSEPTFVLTMVCKLMSAPLARK